ncbi:hypothetical protein [Virgisporangium ochraceum]|uniref:Uncharacterized protein n=1 Tax=Virgisporangium ochraceum TaxID=65505 RepID=A0A8J3ZXV0_9ACTN|nr:hypothetical protein [Virgisporangium ochraceum]GIJ71178.1 hypothetical protein Voc01_060950 [Virgisporangium ochraceum]
MFGFSSYHWDVGELSADDRRALVTLNGASPETPLAGYATHDPHALLAAFRALVHSTDVRARGVALDQYVYAEAQGRWGIENPLVLFDDAVRAAAREMLTAVSRPGIPLTDQPLLLSGWRSALGALTHVGDSSELPLVMTVVEAMAADDLLDRHAFWPVEVRLADADPATRSHVDAWLAGMATDERLPVEVRVEAVGTLGPRHHEEVAGLLRHPAVPLAVAAARYLLDGDPSPEVATRVADVVAGWPGDAPYPADEVRHRLAEIADLATARATLTGPSAETVAGALSTVAEHGTAADLPATLAVLDDDRLVLAGADTVADAVVECLRTADGPVADRAYRALATVYTDGARPVDVRVLALRPFWCRPEHRLDAVAVTTLLTHDDLRLSTAAAMALVGRRGSEAPVRAAAARWPDDAPDPADRVRDLLTDLDDLAAARAVIAAAPTTAGPSRDAAGPVPATSDDARTLLAAIRTVTLDGDASDGPRLLAACAVAGDLPLAWALRRALLRRGDPADARYAAAISGLDARILAGPVNG